MDASSLRGHVKASFVCIQHTLHQNQRQPLEVAICLKFCCYACGLCYPKPWTLLSSDSQIKRGQTEGKCLHLSTYRKRQKPHPHVNVSQSSSILYHQNYLESGIQLVNDPRLNFPPLYWQQKLLILYVLILWNVSEHYEILMSCNGANMSFSWVRGKSWTGEQARVWAVTHTLKII